MTNFNYRYNTRTNPIGIGDILSACYYSELKRVELGLDSFTITFVYPENEFIHDDPCFSHLSRENILAHISRLFDVPAMFKTCSGFGTDIERDSDSKYYNYYSMWIEKIRGEILEIPIAEFYNTKVSKVKKIWGDKYISVNLRNNKSWGQHRNADLEKWKVFFSDHKEMCFLFVGDSRRSFPELTFCENVNFLKDTFNTSVSEDLAIINGAQLFIGSSSGPSIVRLLNNKLSIVDGWDGDVSMYGCYPHDGEIETLGIRTNYMMTRSFNREAIEELLHGR